MKKQRILSILLGLSLVFWPQGVALADTQTPPNLPLSRGGWVGSSSLFRHPEPTQYSLLRHPGFVQDRILDSGVAPKAPQNDGAEGLVLSLPFAVESRWESVNNDTPGIVWQTNISSLAFQTIPTQPPLGRGGVSMVPLLPEEGLGEEGVY